MPPDPAPDRPDPPRITPLGLDGLLVTFADEIGEEANRAAIAFRAAIDAEGWEGVTETASSLTSAYLTFDPGAARLEDLSEKVGTLLGSRDWSDADLPKGRRRVTVPACFEGDHAPRLADAAELAGLSPEDAVAELCANPLRALAVGFAPGQGYLGTLPAHWNLDRQKEITPDVPVGAVVVAVRQAIIFATTTPTGWRQVGMTRFHAFRPDDPDHPIALAPGDEVRLRPVSAAELDRLSPPEGGAEWEEIG